MNRLKDLKVVQKPWGKELWFALVPEAYLGKVIIVYAGETTSLHYHQYKEETLFVYSGELIYRWIDEDGEKKSLIYGRGEFVHVPPGTKHALGASYIEELVLFEVSTCYPEDSIRVEDRYGRKLTEERNG